MLDQELRLLKERLLQPLVGRIARLGLTPNQLTLISFALGILAGHFCLEGRLNAALVLWWLNRVVDGVDGAVARHLHRQTDFGGYLDIICDFIVYTTIPIDLAFFQVTSACSIATSNQGRPNSPLPLSALRPKSSLLFLFVFIILIYSLLFYRLWVQGGGRDVVGSSVLAAGQFVVPPRTTHALSPSLVAWRDLTRDVPSSWPGQGTYFINAASLFMLGGILEKRNLGAQTRGTITGRHPGLRLVGCAMWLAHNSLGVACRVWPRTTGEKTTLTMPVGLIEGTETIIFYSLFIGESSPSSLAPHSAWGHSRRTPTNNNHSHHNTQPQRYHST
jgi:phosphatidylglycerophosphate synthase